MSRPLVVELPTPLACDGLRLWVCDPADPTAYLPHLSSDERDRYDIMRHRPAAARFAVGRGLARQLLAAYVGGRPADLPLTVTADGKPVLPGGPWFNLSHTAGRLLLAISQVPVGVDVEPIRLVPAADDLVRRWFHPAEAEQYFGLPPAVRPAAFRRGWTGKEALLKGIGCGARELAGCVVEMDPDLPSAVRFSPDGRPWALACWEADGFAHAVAVQPATGTPPTHTPVT